jgi:hypothetical protein
VYANKAEVDAWRGPIPIEKYEVQKDPNPEFVKKKLDKIKV